MARLSDTEFVEQKTIRRMVEHLKAKARARGRRIDITPTSTLQIFPHYVRKFCDEVAKLSPDELIAQRKEHLKNDEDEIRRQHEELANKYISLLSSEKKSSNTIASALASVRSFYESNYVPLVAMIVPTGRAEKPVWLPDPEALTKIVQQADLRTSAYVCCAKDSGIGIGDLLEVRWDTESPTFGTVKEQLQGGQIPIHIQFKREKTGVKFDTFFGEDSVRSLKEYANFKRKRIFHISSNQIRLDLKKLDKRLRPHTFRKYFTTYLKWGVASILTKRDTLDAAGISDAWVEYWSGHSLGRVKGAYNIPPVKLQMQTYQEAYDRIKLRG